MRKGKKKGRLRCVVLAFDSASFERECLDDSRGVAPDGFPEGFQRKDSKLEKIEAQTSDWLAFFFFTPSCFACCCESAIGS